MLLYHCYHFKYIELNMISSKSVVELLLLNMWQTSSGIKEDNFDFVSKFDMLKRWSPSSLFTTPNGKRGWPGHVSNAWKISYWEWNMSSLPHYWYDCSYLCYHINHWGGRTQIAKEPQFALGSYEIKMNQAMLNCNNSQNTV